MKRIRSSIVLTLVWVGLLGAGCDSAKTQRLDSTAPQGDSPTAALVVPPDALEQARDAANALGAELIETLLQELSDGGPVQAMQVCSEIAPSIAEKHSTRNRLVGRVSLKPRNPANAPDAFAERKLNELASLHAQGEMPDEIAEMVQEDGRLWLRYLRPISIMPPCLLCHGERDQLDEQVVELLQERYPDDSATGYAVGDLRGAITVSMDLFTQVRRDSKE